MWFLKLLLSHPLLQILRAYGFVNVFEQRHDYWPLQEDPFGLVPSLLQREYLQSLLNFLQPNLQLFYLSLFNESIIRLAIIISTLDAVVLLLMMQVGRLSIMKR